METTKNESNDEKPRLVDTGRGFSVSYKGRLLYSKYAPEKAIEKTLDTLEIRAATIVLCASPALWHGIEKLCGKLGSDCLALGIETDKDLHDFAEAALEKKKAADSSLRAELLPLVMNGKIAEILSREISAGFRIPPVRRVIMIEMSGGAAFGKETYRMMLGAAEDAVSRFWKNRLTLTRFGRLFSRNTIRNIAKIPASVDFRDISGTVSKKILVLGAGEGTGKLIEEIGADKIGECLTIAVDAAVPALSAKGIRIDAIVAVESQLAIEPSYIGARGHTNGTIVFADMSSRSQVADSTGGRLSFFASSYTKAEFLERLKKEDFFPPAIPPLGSVGLTATYIALLLRAGTEIPIAVAGLDFSFSAGRTHTAGTNAEETRLAKRTRLSSDGFFEAAFGNGARKECGKNGDVYTDIALSSYAELFRSAFRAQTNLFDAGKSGLPLGIPDAGDYFWNFPRGNGILLKETGKGKVQAERAAEKWLEDEERALERLRELLMFGNDVARCGKTADEEIESIVSCREYLFLHFPDGYRCDTKNISFLKRIRTETDFFLKDIRKGISMLGK
ncbi:MAG: DUF115 domain-containing protein [Treponema sp.]|uniref:6-hydroxymethylpterin diphosphokinase MptE-like protein n=1 Tax=Treponema sp. TaxID=166 RepID=UPI00257CCE34|nr:6-hydroxymethylpterin diphosphokinase MptE-like protein [Treponema sp.]MBQ5536409.1 DUF115 domain-containing protein [Treponema sp.]